MYVYAYCCGPHPIAYGATFTTPTLSYMPPSMIGPPSACKANSFEVVVRATKKGYAAAKSGGMVILSEQQWRKKKPQLFFESLSYLNQQRGLGKAASQGILTSSTARATAGCSTYVESLEKQKVGI